MQRYSHICKFLCVPVHFFCRWNDNAPVTMVSSILGDKPMSTARRYNRTAKKYIEVPQPDVVLQYNRNMGGVDRFDQNLNHLRISVGGKKWYWQIITWLLDASMQNAWQLHKKAGGSLTALEFRREVVCYLLMEAAAVSRNNSGSGRQTRPGEADLRYDNVGHYPVIRKNQRQVCKFDGCTTRCQVWCEKCNRCVCIYHFKDYHCR